MHTKTFHRKKIFIVFGLSLVMLIGLAGRLVWLMVFEADYYQQLATDLHERERSIKAARGRILDRNGEVLADNRTVCTIFRDSQPDRRSGSGDSNAGKRTGTAGGDRSETGGKGEFH